MINWKRKHFRNATQMELIFLFINQYTLGPKECLKKFENWLFLGICVFQMCALTHQKAHTLRRFYALLAWADQDTFLGFL